MLTDSSPMNQVSQRSALVDFVIVDEFYQHGTAAWTADRPEENVDVLLDNRIPVGCRASVCMGYSASTPSKLTSKGSKIWGPVATIRGLVSGLW